jgi:NAD(P)-dependent dehydrogenase (short-subunit alcohol dehydrogenase family)
MSKTWFITGSWRGIGAAIARAALPARDNVVATGRRDEHNFGDCQTMKDVERKHILATLKQTKWIVGGPRRAARRWE